MSDEHKECCESKDVKGTGWRVSLSITMGVGWLVFLIIWLFFYATQYSAYQNVAIFLLSILAMIGLAGGPWLVWGLRQQTDKEKEMWKTKGFRWRVWLSCLLVLAVVVFLIYWFWYQAESWNLYQNIAMLIVSLLIAGGVMGAAWAPWGMRYGKKFEKEKEP
jgi:hypothetical protein